MSCRRSAAAGAASVAVGGTADAQPVKVETGVVNREAKVGRYALGDRRDVALVNLVNLTAPDTREMVVVLGSARDVGVDVPVLLEAPRDAGGGERLERAEDGRAPDPRLAPPQSIVEVLGRDLPADCRQGVGHEKTLARDALAGLTKAIGGRVDGQCPPTARAKTEKA